VLGKSGFAKKNTLSIRLLLLKINNAKNEVFSLSLVNSLIFENKITVFEHFCKQKTRAILLTLSLLRHATPPYWHR